MDKFDISVVIVAKNGESTIRRQLTALAQQVDAPAFEVIVVDNGSTDNTVKVVEEWRRGDLGAVSELTLVDASDRPGIPHARNSGALATRGRVIAWCDCDDRVRKNWVQAFAATQDNEIVSGPLDPVDSAGRPAAGEFSGIYPTEYLPFASNCNLALSRKLFFRVGGYDESLPVYGAEDVELCWRIQEAGYFLRLDPEARIWYTVSPRKTKVRKEFLAAVGFFAAKIRHPKSFGRVAPTPGIMVRNFLGKVIFLPRFLIRPEGRSRPQRIREVILASGHLYSYWRYVLRKIPPMRLESETELGGPA